MVRLRPSGANSEDAPVEIPRTRYAETVDGVYLAYQTLGDGPLDIVWQPEWPGNIDFEWDTPATGRCSASLRHSHG